MRYILISFFIVFTCSASAQDSLILLKKEIIYGRKDGMALTMTIVTPKQKSNGKAIISVLSRNPVSA